MPFTVRLSFIKLLSAKKWRSIVRIITSIHFSCLVNNGNKLFYQEILLFKNSTILESADFWNVANLIISVKRTNLILLLKHFLSFTVLVDWRKQKRRSAPRRLQFPNVFEDMIWKTTSIVFLIFVLSLCTDFLRMT